MTVLLEYEQLVGGGKEVKRVVEDVNYLTIMSRGGSEVIVTPKGETVGHLDAMGENYRIVGEVRLG